MHRHWKNCVVTLLWDVGVTGVAVFGRNFWAEKLGGKLLHRILTGPYGRIGPQGGHASPPQRYAGKMAESASSSTKRERKAKRAHAINEEEQHLEDFLFGDDNLDRVVKQSKLGKEWEIAKELEEEKRLQEQVFTISTEGSDETKEDESDSEEPRRKRGLTLRPFQCINVFSFPSLAQD